jgi:hypothetical protein
MFSIEDIDSAPTLAEFLGFEGSVVGGTIVRPEIAKIQEALQKLAFYTHDKDISSVVDQRLTSDLAKKINHALRVWAVDAPGWMRTGKLPSQRIADSALDIAQALVDARRGKEAEAEKAAAERGEAARREEEERAKKYGEAPPSTGFCPGAKPCPSGQVMLGPPDCKCVPRKDAEAIDIAKRKAYAAQRAGHASSQIMYQRAGQEAALAKLRAKKMKAWLIGGATVTVFGLAAAIVVKRVR